MKLKTIVVIALCAGLISCNNVQNSGTTDIVTSIAGTYVRAFAGEYASGHDTLIVDVPYEGNNFYKIKHNSSYQRVIEKKVQPMTYKSEVWMAVFDEKENVLVEQKKGKQIRFVPEKNILLVGLSEYRKIN